MSRGLLEVPRAHFYRYSIEMASIGRKRSHSGSSSSNDSQSKHKVGYNARWETDFPWHVPIYESADESTVVGLLYSV